jgi:hypothetical protein
MHHNLRRDSNHYKDTQNIKAAKNYAVKSCRHGFENLVIQKGLGKDPNL